MSLAVTPRPKLRLDLDQHGLRLLLPQALRRQHVLDLGGADAEGQRAECAVRRGMRIAAHHGHAGQGQALFGPMTWTMPWRMSSMRNSRDAELGAVGVERLDLQARDRVGDAERGRWWERCGRARRPPHRPGAHLAAGQFQPLERLRAGDFVHQVAVDIQQRGAVGLEVDDVSVPEFLKKGLAGHTNKLIQRVKR
jgi:hypothetical protein